MKNFTKLFGVIAIVAVIGFGMAACEDDPEDSSDAFAGTWISEEDGMKIVASNGSLTVYDSMSAEGAPISQWVWSAMGRGTYTVSGNNVSVTITQFNQFDWETNTDNWIPYDDLSDAMKQEVPRTMTGSISGSQITINGATFTKQ